MRASVIIETVLKESPETRSSDKELYIKVWEHYGFYMSESQKAEFRELPSSETIRRIRQKLQEKGQYQASEKIARHRHVKSQEVQQRMPTTKPEKIQPMLEDIMPRAVSASKEIVDGMEQSKLL